MQYNAFFFYTQLLFTHNHHVHTTFIYTQLLFTHKKACLPSFLERTCFFLWEWHSPRKQASRHNSSSFSYTGYCAVSSPTPLSLLIPPNLLTLMKTTSSWQSTRSEVRSSCSSWTLFSRTRWRACSPTLPRYGCPAPRWPSLRRRGEERPRLVERYRCVRCCTVPGGGVEGVGGRVMLRRHVYSGVWLNHSFIHSSIHSIDSFIHSIDSFIHPFISFVHQFLHKYKLIAAMQPVMWRR